uniref:Little elongation complex subunit 2 n=1 Tax=Cacopsylla melanoneura TaxID=428564 RepID=A0A8D8RXC2_9HEMI
MNSAKPLGTNSPKPPDMNWPKPSSDMTSPNPFSATNSPKPLGMTSPLHVDCIMPTQPTATSFKPTTTTNVPKSYTSPSPNPYSFSNPLGPNPHQTPNPYSSNPLGLNTHQSSSPLSPRPHQSPGHFGPFSPKPYHSPSAISLKISQIKSELIKKEEIKREVKEESKDEMEHVRTEEEEEDDDELEIIENIDSDGESPLPVVEDTTQNSSQPNSTLSKCGTTAGQHNSTLGKCGTTEFDHPNQLPSPLKPPTEPPGANPSIQVTDLKTSPNQPIYSPNQPMYSPNQPIYSANQPMISPNQPMKSPNDQPNNTKPTEPIDYSKQTNDGRNRKYTMWRLLKEYQQGSELLKNTRHPLNILVRSKQDAQTFPVRFGNQRAQHNTHPSFLTIRPKVEYQVEFGAEVLSLNELLDEWISLYLRPNTDLLRVRVAADNLEVLMSETYRPVDVFHTMQSQHGVNPRYTIGNLYSVLWYLMDLPQGFYLLSHEPKTNAFVNVYQADPKGSLFPMAGWQCSEGVPRTTWRTIDPSIVTPVHNHERTLPAMFPPSDRGSAAKQNKRKQKHVDYQKSLTELKIKKAKEAKKKKNEMKRKKEKEKKEKETKEKEIKSRDSAAGEANSSSARKYQNST